MARFISSRITHPKTGGIYEIELSIDRLAALRENLSIEIVARKRASPNSVGEEISATLSVDEGGIVLEIEGEIVGRISLGAPGILEADDEDLGQQVARGAWEAVRDNIITERPGGAADIIEDFLEGLPGFDPALGCLLKGAISAVVPQIIRCYFEIPKEVEGWRRRLRELARCLGRSAWIMLGKASARAVRCMVWGS